MKTTPSRFDALVRRADAPPDTDDAPAPAPPADTDDAPADFPKSDALPNHATEEPVQNEVLTQARPARRVGRRRNPDYRAVTLYLPVALHEAALETARRNKRAGVQPDTASGVVEAALRAADWEDSSSTG